MCLLNIKFPKVLSQFITNKSFYWTLRISSLQKFDKEVDA